MAGIEHAKLLVLASYETHYCFSLRRRTDVILFPRDSEDRAGDLREIHAPPTQVNLTLDQLVLLVEVADPLPECFTSERHSIVDPLVHGEQGTHRLVMEEAIPHRDIDADIVGDRLDQAIASIDNFAWNVGEGIHQEIGVKVLLAHPDAIETHVFWCEVNGSRQQNQVFERKVREQGRIHGAHRSPHTIAQDTALLGVGMPEYPFDGTRDIIKDIMVEGKIFILFARNAPVKEIDIKPLVHQVLYDTIAWHQIQNIATIDERVDAEKRNRKALLAHWLIMIEPGFVLRPDHFFGRLACLDMRTVQHHLHPRLILFERMNGIEDPWGHLLVCHGTHL